MSKNYVIAIVFGLGVGLSFIGQANLSSILVNDTKKEKIISKIFTLAGTLILMALCGYLWNFIA